MKTLFLFIAFSIIGLAGFVLLVPGPFSQNAEEDQMLWGLKKNPTLEKQDGVTKTSMIKDIRSTNSLFSDFYEAKKRLPKSFSELVQVQKELYPNLKNQDPSELLPGKYLAKKQHILKISGQNTSTLALEFSDGSKCYYDISSFTFLLVCNRRDWKSKGNYYAEALPGMVFLSPAK